MDLDYRILNVFTVGDDPFSGNPLAVFEDAGHLSDEVMQRLARQLNLSETTFVTAVDAADREAVRADVRIFTTSYEMPFAGHPTLGTAQVVADLTGGPASVTLHVPAGAVPVERTQADGRSCWTLTTAVAPRVRPPEATRAEVAAMLGLRESDLGDDPLFVDTGVEQLVVPLASVAAVRAVDPVAGLLTTHGRSGLGEAQVQVWAASGPDEIEARFVLVEGSGVVEDPATGSACANLGGWFTARGAHLDDGLHLTLSQGAAVQRPSRLVLDVDPDGRIRVSGTVLEVGRGRFHLPG